MNKVVFATYAQSNEELANIITMTESIRQFAGKYKDAPVWVYVSEYFDTPDSIFLKNLTGLDVELKTGHAPEDAMWFYYAGKTYASGEAEAAAEKAGADILIWMDEDTVILQEPEKLILGENIGLAYRPVMHNRSGSLYSEPPDQFWSRIYEKLKITDEMLFPMVTPADNQTIRAYFNAGLLAVRPRYGILRAWGESFKILYTDSVLADMCRSDVERRIFIHQTALVGAVLPRLDRSQMIELPGTYNYPLFFNQMFESSEEFESIDDIVTMRYDVYFRNPDPDWSQKLQGPPEKIAWLTARLGE